MSSPNPSSDMSSPDPHTHGSNPAVRCNFSPPTSHVIPPLLSKLLAQGSRHLDAHGTPMLDKHFESIDMRVTLKEWKRFQVCMLLALGFPTVLACALVGNIKPKSFDDTRDADWYGRFVKDPFSCLRNKKHTRKRKQMDDSTVKCIKERCLESGRTLKRLCLNGFREYIAQVRDELGDTRELPSKATICKTLKSLGAKFFKKNQRAMVKRPWDARYRMQFARKMHDIIVGKPGHVPQPHYARTIIFADEKPFRLFDSQSGAGYTLKDENGQVPENNVAKKLTTANAATADEKYIEFMDRVR